MTIKSQPNGRWCRVDKRLAIYLRDHFTCLVCGTDLHGAKPQDVTLDHIIPVSKGGSNHESNIYTCCRSCNCARQTTPLAKFAPPASLQRIRRNVKHVLKRYRVLAKAILAGEIGLDDVEVK